MRVRIGKTEPKEFRCCICFHVRAGTLIYGIYFLLTQLIVFSCLTALTTRPELARQWQAFLRQEVDNDQGMNATDVINLERAFIEQSRYMWLLTLMAVICVCMLIYGTITGRASFLLPFLILRIFDFFVACLVIIGCFAYIVDVQNWVKGWPEYPYVKDIKHYLLTLSPDTLMLIFVILFVTYLVVKAYLLGMLWNTHKYLRGLELERARGQVRRYDLETDMDQALLPPKYEDVVKFSDDEEEDTPPPPYSAS